MSPVLNQKVWCGQPDCGAYLGRHVAIRFEDRTAYGGFQLAPGLVNRERFTYGPPSGRPRGLPRSFAELVHKRRGTITISCPRCNAAQAVVIGPATVLASHPIRNPEIG